MKAAESYGYQLHCSNGVLISSTERVIAHWAASQDGPSSKLAGTIPVSCPSTMVAMHCVTERIKTPGKGCHAGPKKWSFSCVVR